MMLKDTIKIKVDPRAKVELKRVASKLYAKFLREKTQFDVEEIQLLSVWVDSCLTLTEQETIRRKVDRK